MLFKDYKKISCNKKGFTLTEVMIGIMILTVAIVSASNLLVSLINTNKTNVKALQAYYLAQEGIEAIRNIRDTNWLHNLNFKGDFDAVYEPFEIDNAYKVFLREAGWDQSTNLSYGTQNELSALRPWDFEKVSPILNIDPFSSEFALTKNGDTVHYISNGADEDAVFYRHIEILPFCNEGTTEEDCENFILVRSVVNWRDGNDDGEISLDAVLSNWKGGAM